MRQLTAMLWKEWRECVPLLLVGLFVFLGLPIIGGVEGMAHYAHRFEILTSPWVIAFGGFYFLLIAVAATCRDLQAKLEGFWRSRPVSVVHWFLAKYAVGLAVGLFVCEAALLVERWTASRNAADLPVLVLMPLVWTALYSVAFACGCLVRRNAHAAMLALAGTLLVYFLPLVLPPLRSMNVFQMLDFLPLRTGWTFFTRPNLIFAAGMILLATVLLVLSLAAVRFEFHIDAGRRLMYGAVSAALLLIVATAGYQLGTNLPAITEQRLPVGESVTSIRLNGASGYVITRQFTYPNDVAYTRTFQVNAANVQIGNRVEVANIMLYRNYGSAYTDARVSYVVSDDGTGEESKYNLDVTELDDPVKASVPRAIHLWDAVGRDRWQPSVYCVKDRLYVFGRKIATFDVSEPATPRLLSIADYGYRLRFPADASNLTLSLPAVPGLAKEDWLALTLNEAWYGCAFDGKYLVASEYRFDPSHRDRTERLIAWRLDSLTNEAAHFVPVGEFRPTLLDEMFGASRNSDLHMRDGLLYVSSGNSLYGRTRLTVFDLHSEHPMKPAGHFSAPLSSSTIYPLPGGRALLGGQSIWLLGPPATRK